MARTLYRLTSEKINSVTVRGHYADGGGLYLQVTPTLVKSWVFRFAHGGRARAMGLGSLHTTSLAEARASALACRKLLLAGKDPIEERKAWFAINKDEIHHARRNGARSGTPPLPNPPLNAMTRPLDSAATIVRSASEHPSPFYFLDGEGEFRPNEVAPGSTTFVEGRIATPWLEVNVRRLSSEQPVEAVFSSPLACLSTEFNGTCYSGDRVAFWERGLASDFVPGGECAFIPAGQTVHFRSASVRYRKVTCLFDPAKFDAFRDWEWSDLELGLCLNIKEPRIRDGLLLLAREALQPGFASEVLAESIVMGMIVDLVRIFKNVATSRLKPGMKLAPWQLQLIRERVETATGRPPSIAALATACAVSPRHLERIFKNTTEMTISTFIADARIRQAKALLARPDKMIKAIAYECCFHTPAAFAAAFRKVTGRSPRQYRLDVLASGA